MAMTLEQQRVIALARARRRRQEATAGAPATGGASSASAGSPEAPTPPAEPGWVDTIMGVADQGARGVATGVTNLLGLPRTIQQTGLGVLEYGLDKVGAPQSVQDAAGAFRRGIDILPSAEGMQGALDSANDATADALGVERPDRTPDSRAERMVNRIGEEAGAFALPAAGIASYGAKIGPEAARQLPALGRMFVERAAVAPSSYIGRETALAGGAGLGAAIANETVDRNTTAGAIADFVGAIGGAGATALSGAIGSRGSEVLQAIFGRQNYVDDVVREGATDRIVSSAGIKPSENGAPDTAEIVRLIEEGNRIDGTVPGFNESLADRTQNLGIANLEYGRQTGPNSGMFTQRREDNANAVDAAISRNAPTGTPGALRSELQTQRDIRLTDAELARTTAEQEAMDAIMGLQPRTTPAQRGNTIRTGLEDSREAARQRTEDAYANADVSRRQVDPAPLARSLDEEMAGLTEIERGLVPQGVIERVARLGRTEQPDATPVSTGLLDASGQPITRAPPAPAAPDPIELREATQLRSELQRLQAAAVADPRAERGGRNAARVLGGMIDRVEGFIGSSLPADDYANLLAARGARRAEGDQFGRSGDPVADALARREGGQPRVRDDQVARRFANPQAMDRLFQEADTPAVRAAIRDEVLSNADLGDAARILRFREEYAEQLARFPGLSDELGQAAAARGRETSARTAETSTRRQLGDDTTVGRGAVGQYLQYGDERAQSAMQTVLNAKEPGRAADEILEFAGNSPAAVEGARKAFWDIMESQTRRNGESTASASGSQPWMPNRLRRFLDEPRNQAVADRLYRDNPEHLGNVRQIAEALRSVDVRNSVRAPNTSGTAQGVNSVLTPETIQSRFYNYQSGRIGGSFLVTSILAVAGRRAVAGARKEAIDRVLDDALLNPDVAALLLRENNPANRAAMRRYAKVWFGNSATNVLNAMSAEDEDDETVRASMGGSFR